MSHGSESDLRCHQERVTQAAGPEGEYSMEYRTVILMSSVGSLCRTCKHVMHSLELTSSPEPLSIRVV